MQNLQEIKICAVKVSIGKFVPLAVQEGSGTQSEGFPMVLSPISDRTEMGGKARHKRIKHHLKHSVKIRKDKRLIF